MAEIKDDLRYTDDHEWVMVDEDDEGVVWVGVTDYAQGQLGDVVMVEVPSVGDDVVAGDAFGTVESPKSVSDLFSPVTGEVVAVNEDLDDSPELVNEAPYTDGWIIKVKMSDPSELDRLMNAEAYAAHVEKAEQG
ncbi:MAG: glycine cleavage system protein H [Deltaproteobacteria bacterium HGW-Deltaproteobacteria-14]|jgi:glycine cleavage system H protein|nr:MAG: glycine cleavage system protein H [Deltaproteobacteria bacterium HGW-Deltaproteobacteria-14]